MEIEVKVRLKQQADYSRTISLFAALPATTYKSTNNQINYFFDTKNKDLQKVRSNFRLRSVQKIDTEGMQSSKFYITSKSKGTLVAGISRILELEESVTLDQFNAIMNDPPSSISRLASDIPMLRTVMDQFDTSSFHNVGSFANKRVVYQWKDLCVEIDETTYEFGTSYEVEIEHLEPEKAKAMLEELFVRNGIMFGDCSRSKFGNLIAGSLLE